MMKRCKLFVLLFSFVGARLVSYSWPHDNAYTVSHFGCLNSGLLSRSIEIDGDFKEICPVSEGSIIFEHDALDDFFPTQSGTTLIMQHQGGICVIYSGLEATIATPFQTVRETDILASRTPYQPISLAFYDYQTSQYVNPLVFLPKENINYHRLVLLGVVLKSEDQNEFFVHSDTVLPVGRYEVLVSAQEITDGRFLTPYQIQLEVMGDMVTQIIMDTLVSEQGIGLLKSQQETTIYDAQGRFKLGYITLLPGQSFITIRLSAINNLNYNYQFRLIAN